MKVNLFAKPLGGESGTMKAANVALHEGLHGQQHASPVFQDAMDKIRNEAMDFMFQGPNPHGFNPAYIGQPKELMARGVADTTLRQLFPGKSPQQLYGADPVRQWYYSQSWPESLNPLWLELSQKLLQ